MSHYDDVESGYYRREDYEDRMESLGRPHPHLFPEVCGGTFQLAEETTYGDDADGRRGIPLRLWVCDRCEEEQEIRG